MHGNTLTREVAQATLAAMERYGNQKKAAQALGIAQSTMSERMTRIRKNGWHLSEGVQDSMTRAGLDVSTIRGGHRRVYDDDGKQIDTVRYTVAQDVADITEKIDQATDSALERIKVVAPSAPTLIRPKNPDGALMGFLPLFDAHLGLQMPGYGLDDAVARLVGASFEAIDAMPAAGCIAIINGGDFTHQNDDSNQTPAHRHPLPISANYLDTTDAATDARIAIIEYAARKFGSVETKDLRGNHDPNTAKIVRAALRQRYRDHEQIKVDLEGVTHFSRIFGNNLITGHHGDIKRQLKDLALALSDKYRKERAAARFHEHHTGHLHHIKELRFDMGGIHFCQHGAISPKSNHDDDNLYRGDSILQGITYRERGGRKSTIEVHLE